jgi:hypothetical protein
MPINLRPKFAQATPVVPLPMKGSRTIPAGFAKLPTILSFGLAGVVLDALFQDLQGY